MNKTYGKWKKDLLKKKNNRDRKLKSWLICMLNTRDGSPNVFLHCVFYGAQRQLKPVLSNWISKAWELFQFYHFRKCDHPTALCLWPLWNCVLASNFWLGYVEDLYISWNVPNTFYYCHSITFYVVLWKILFFNMLKVILNLHKST